MMHCRFVVVLLAACCVGHSTAFLRSRSEEEKVFARSVVCVEAEEKVDTEDPQPTKLGLIVHRKSGYIMSNHVAKCFSPDGTVVHRLADTRMHANFTHGSDEAKYVHFARDPIKLVVSNFLYHKFTSYDPRTLSMGSANTMVKIARRHCEGPAADIIKDSDGAESWREYLHRVDNHTALLATLCQTVPGVWNMMQASKWCLAHQKRCMQVDTDELMESSAIYMSTFEHIADFAGFAWTPKLKECLRFQDINSEEFNGNPLTAERHCKMHAVSLDMRAKIKETARRQDRMYLGSFYRDVGSVLANVSTVD